MSKAVIELIEGILTLVPEDQQALRTDLQTVRGAVEVECPTDPHREIDLMSDVTGVLEKHVPAGSDQHTQLWGQSIRHFFQTKVKEFVKSHPEDKILTNVWKECEFDSFEAINDIGIELRFSATEASIVAALTPPASVREVMKSLPAGLLPDLPSSMPLANLLTSIAREHPELYKEWTALMKKIAVAMSDRVTAELKVIKDGIEKAHSCKAPGS
jgi:hypothetical protein